MEPQEGRRIASFRATKRSTKLRRLSKTTRSRVNVQTVGLNAETKKVSAPSQRRKMSLDIPFYRTFPISANRTNENSDSANDCVSPQKHFLEREPSSRAVEPNRPPTPRSSAQQNRSDGPCRSDQQNCSGKPKYPRQQKRPIIVGPTA